MSEFVNRSIGARQHSYPENRKAAGAAVFARNFGYGPAADAPVPIVTTPGTEVPWGTRGVAGVDIHDIPITPRTTGVIRILAMVNVGNSTSTEKDLLVQVLLNGSAVEPEDMQVTVPPANTAEERNGYVLIPILIPEVAGLTIGTTYNVRILLTALTNSALTIPLAQTTSIEVSEVPVSTG
jgi:hypothetical protein